MNAHGGTHHGYFLPSEGAGDRAMALVPFHSFADYEIYRNLFDSAPKFLAAMRFAMNRNMCCGTSGRSCGLL
ncbi:NIPSNAP family protein [Rhodococcoides fascians]|uniref:NIPSNAP family protein n=1 Tax=Rhodococcoides fascians TaxID=1828 RepID=UPI000A7C918B|nr:NIPSNAP family protein [Rhodococcus fascians]